ncbi:uncharacterized protein LOC127257732 [Andrographis paniculata]|uniref:uncharacterized protein LOC127257732 n=1 Tax=Andrographis paniculata TaxID=175694 RepID=UPI0021E8EA61|nr:uncharacterized protein LOC127257732 [Andrographis paniculata]
MWDCIDEADIQIKHFWLIQLLMKFGAEYESMRASLLHRHPLPSFETTIKEILFEDTCLKMLKALTIDSALAVPSSTPHRRDNCKDARPPQSDKCRSCPNADHLYIYCPKVECHFYHQKGHIRSHCPTNPKTGQSSSSFSSVIAAATSVSQSPQRPPTLEDLRHMPTPVLSIHPSLASTSGSRHADGLDTWDGSQDRPPILTFGGPLLLLLLLGFATCVFY